MKGLLAISLAISIAFTLGLLLGQQLSPDPANPTSPKPPIFQSGATSPFAEVIQQGSGQKVLPIGKANEPVLDLIATAAEATREKMNRPTSPLIGLARINEASRHFEDSLRELLDGHPDLSCHIPLTREGKAQRSGYPDLLLTHHPTGTTYYLDPKLYEASAEDSSLRTFYYTPRRETSKILTDGHHLLLGFAHDGHDGQWQFLHWKLIDLSRTTLKLKSEYNASNKDLYQEKSVIRRSQ
ncbi:hypothetical protein [Roseibacillus ishigakijimensis]|uniref:Uncharacterized protein n=1 Tax=Roseibacillus ishigakijimensis TaxID=454146 RepID=A0A934VLC6_9BACT|nr:hypothetical protein [Roseibacillus ishigakijimensis]MBK1832745.1 hypothetical protein [Roseibacillus ishigakijimensis]